MNARPISPAGPASVPVLDQADGLTAALTEHRVRLSTLLDLAERQAELLEVGDTDGLVAVLLAKQPLVEQVVAAQNDLVAAIRARPAGRHTPGDAVADALRAECQGLLGELTRREAAAEQAATALRDSLGRQARALTDAQRAKSAYRPFTG